MSSSDKARLEIEAVDRAESAEQSGRPQLWQRQAGESAKAYSAFSKYRDLADQRTMAKVAAMSGCSTQNIERWARRWAWTHRVYEYDVVQEEVWQRQASRDRLQMRRRQIQIGQALQGVAAYALREWQEKIEKKQSLGLDPVEVLGMMKLGNELEARGHGEERDGGRFTKINVIIGTLSDEVFEEQCRAGGGKPAKRPGDGGATMTFEEFERRQYENLSDEEKAAEATWRDPPPKLTN